MNDHHHNIIYCLINHKLLNYMKKKINLCRFKHIVADLMEFGCVMAALCWPHIVTTNPELWKIQRMETW